jgi:sortase A
MAEPTRHRQEQGPEPSALRVLGIVLVVIGLVGALLGAWHLWGTGWLTARTQTRLATEFQERLLAMSEPTALPLGDEARGAAAEISMPVEWDDPVVTPGVVPEISLEGLTDIVPESAPGVGAPVGRIVIERIGVDWIVVEGVDQEQLADGPGHMPQTPLPGQPGNAVISGHRTTNGGPFYDLDALEPGDAISIETLIGTHSYQVVDRRIVAPDDVWVTFEWDGGWLTLTTCHPRYSSRQRLVVIAQLVAGPNAAVIHGRYGVPVDLPGA